MGKRLKKARKAIGKRLKKRVKDTEMMAKVQMAMLRRIECIEAFLGPDLAEFHEKQKVRITDNPSAAAGAG